jgi:hypothetical protein
MAEEPVMTAHGAAVPPSPGHLAERHRWTVWLLGALTGVQLGLVMAQAVFAGSFLTGNGAALRMHEMLGTEVLTSVSLAQFVSAILVWRPGRRSAWPILVAAVTFGLIFMQIEWGFGNHLTLHVPNALAIFAAQFVILGLLRPSTPAVER